MPDVSTRVAALQNQAILVERCPEPFVGAILVSRAEFHRSVLLNSIDGGQEVLSAPPGGAVLPDRRIRHLTFTRTTAQLIDKFNLMQPADKVTTGQLPPIGVDRKDAVGADRISGDEVACFTGTTESIVLKRLYDCNSAGVRHRQDIDVRGTQSRCLVHLFGCATHSFAREVAVFL